MSEQDLREGLRAAVVDEPALSFDPDTLITRARRESARRRTLVAAGVATTAVAVAAVAVPTMLGSPRGGMNIPAAHGTDPPVPATPTPCPAMPRPLPEKLTKLSSAVPIPTSINVEPPECVPSSVAPPSEPTIDLDWPPANITPAHYTAEQLRQRGAEMREYLGKRFAEVVPGATEIAPGEFGGEAAGAVTDGQSYLEALTGFTLNNARSAVDIYVSAPGAPDGPTPKTQCGDGIPPRCQVDRLADGSLRAIQPERAGRGGMILSVTHYRNDGTAVRASGYSYDPVTGAEPTYLPGVPLTIAQLTALATDPALSL